MATYQPQQPGVPPPSYPPQYVQQQLQPLAVPPQLKRRVYFISIALMCGGSASMIFGIVGLAAKFYSISGSSGVNLWAGLFYLICGVLGICHYRNPINPSLLHAFYAFAIIGLIFSVPHIAISIGAFNHYDAVVAVFSLIFALIGISLTIAIVVILSQHIYCGRNGVINQHRYTGTTVTVTQPGVIYTGNPAMPQQQFIYNQQMPAGGMAQPVQTPNQQMPTVGMVQPVPDVNSQPTDTKNEKPPIA